MFTFIGVCLSAMLMNIEPACAGAVHREKAVLRLADSASAYSFTSGWHCWQAPGAIDTIL
jgi:hypothetical protein